VEHAGLRILIMMLKHIAHAHAEQILSPYIVATQVAQAFLGQGLYVLRKRALRCSLWKVMECFRSRRFSKLSRSVHSYQIGTDS
jgi:hypothetical protein